MQSLLTILAILFARSAPAADPPAIRAELQATLADMSSAVLAADEPGFLAHIAQDDPLFATEWKHWADQLKDYKPAEFQLAIGEGDSRFDDDRAEFPLAISWLITSGPEESWGAGGQHRIAAFPTVVFTRDDPDGPGPLPSRWLFRGEKWERLAGDGFTVLYLSGSEAVAAEVAKAFPIARDHDAEGFGVKPPPQTLKLFTSMDHLKATVYLNMPDRYLGGWNEPGESIKFLTSYARGVQGWTNAYAHEFGHVCTWELGPHAKILPWWVQEGAAELAAMEYRPGYWDRLDASTRKAAKNGTLAAWADISDYITTRPPLKGLAYTQGHHMLGYISQRWGREGRNRWLRAMAADGKSLDGATRAALGMPFDQLDAEWRAELVRAPGAP